MKLLKPFVVKKQYISKIEKVITDFLLDVYINPLLQIIKPIKDYYNSSDYNLLIEAILNQEIQYVNGMFFGSFNAQLSKSLVELGAKWNKVYKAYVIDEDLLPIDVRSAIAQANMKSELMQKQILEFLDNFNIETFIPDLNKMLDIPLDWTLEDLDEQSYNVFFSWQKPKADREKSELRKELEKTITVSPESEKKGDIQRAKLNESKREFIKKEYTENIDLSIRTFTNKEATRLRELVEQNALYGLANNKNLVQTIQKEFNTTLQKATFLARNETGIFVAKYHEAKARELGLTTYVWYGVNDEREREYHKKLNGLVFDFDNPPIVDAKGKRANPGFDYNCRCQARIIMPSEMEKIEQTDKQNGEKGGFNLSFFKKKV